MLRAEEKDHAGRPQRHPPPHLLPPSPTRPDQLLHRRCRPVQHVHLRTECLLFSGLLFLLDHLLHRVLPPHHSHPRLRIDNGRLEIREDAVQPPHLVHTEECNIAGTGGLLLYLATHAFVYHRGDTAFEGAILDCRNRGEGE